MKKLSFHIPRDQELNETTEWLNELMINALKDLGFEFKAYAHVMDEDDEQGVHVLKFNEVEELSIMSDMRKGDYESMVQLCTQDDDGQPAATHRLYNGTLWVFIPYTA